MIDEIKFYWQLVLQRLPLMLPLVVLCSLVGLVIAIRLPATYQTNALLLVESAIVEGEGQGGRSTAEELQIIREQLLTRANMLDIAFEFSVFEDYSSLPPDQIFNAMRYATDISPRGGRDQATTIRVSFTARSGQIAADVVNEYVTRIMNSSVERRTGVADETLEFYQQEVERLSTELSRRSAEITQFQTENADALPTEQSFRLERQAVLQERVANMRRELSSFIDQRVRLVQIYEQTQQLPSTQFELSPNQVLLQQLEEQLEDLLLVYTEAAPQVQNLQRRVEQVRGRVAVATGATDENLAVSQSELLFNEQIRQIDAQILDLETSITQAESELGRLEDAIARTPLNATTLQAMEREYQNIVALYDSAAYNLQQAMIDTRIIETNRGQRVMLVESANVPQSPTSPNRRRIALMGGMAGVGLAAALFLLLELLSQKVIRRPVDIQRGLVIEALASIPYIETPRERFQRIALRVAALFAVIVVLPAALWTVNQYYIPLPELANMVLSHLGMT